MLVKNNRWIVVFLLSIVILLFSANTYAFDLRLGTGPSGSFSYFSGRVLCRLINKQATDMSCQQVAAVDDVYNLTNLQGGSLDIILVDSRQLFDAINKSGKFQFLDINYGNLCALAPLYDTPTTLVVRNDADISALSEIKGKRINAGAPGSIQNVFMKKIMLAKNWSKSDFSLLGNMSPGQSNDDKKAFCYGTMQAMLYVGIHPDFSLRHLLKTCNGRLLNMDDSQIKAMLRADPALWKIELPAETYPSQSEKVITFGTRSLLVASEDLDQETVRKVIAVFDNNKEYLEDIHQSLGLYAVERVKKSALGLRYHPGLGLSSPADQSQ